MDRISGKAVIQCLLKADANFCQNLELEVLYRDYSQETFIYPVDRRRGVVTYSLLNKEYIEKGGFLTYKSTIVDSNGQVVKEWKQMRWVEPIKLEEPAESDRFFESASQ